jgi:DNA modification methylase
MNRLYYGDNLSWLQRHDEFPNESIDLIYLDPPFNSNTDYNIIFNEKRGDKSQAQLKAFDDTWKWERESAHQALLELTVSSPSISEFIRWLSRHGDTKCTSMAAYLSMMAVRLIELHRVLKPTGSIYLHCDTTASHYLKILFDAVFGTANFRNEISWRRSQTRSSISRIFKRSHDVLLFYSKSVDYQFNLQYKELSEASLDLYSREDAKGLYRLVPLVVSGKRNGETGKIWREIDPNLCGKSGSHWITKPLNLEIYDEQGLIVWPIKKGGLPQLKYYLADNKGVPVTDFWDDIDIIPSSSSESMGYPTQKPEVLLERIISASSNEGDLILDPFCGCGTSIAVANKLNRKWIGIDVTYLAIDLIEKRLIDSFGIDIKKTYKIRGNPFDFASAQILFERDNKDKHAFELWALSLVDARSRIKDSGVDGIIGFTDDANEPRRIVVQVKGGSTLTPSIIRDLDGTVKNENAVMGLLITLHQPTKGMYEYANHAGDYKTIQRDKPFPLLQIRTVSQLLEGKLFDLPISKKPERMLYTECERNG